MLVMKAISHCTLYFLYRSDWDRSRSERLAQLRIEERVGKRQLKTASDVPEKHMLEKLEYVDLQVELVREMNKKHFYEREVSNLSSIFCGNYYRFLSHFIHIHLTVIILLSFSCGGLP